MKYTLLFIIGILIFSCNGNYSNADKKSFVKEYTKVEKQLIRGDYEELWKYNPVFRLEDAIKLASNNNKEILLSFIGYGDNGNPRMIWELLKNEEIYKEIDENYILCMFITDVQGKFSATDSLTIVQKTEMAKDKYINKNNTNWFVILDGNGRKCSQSVSIMIEKHKDKLLELLKIGCK